VRSLRGVSHTYRGTMDATRKLADVPIPPEMKKRLLTVLY